MMCENCKRGMTETRREYDKSRDKIAVTYYCYFCSVGTTIFETNLLNKTK